MDTPYRQTGHKPSVAPLGHLIASIAAVRVFMVPAWGLSVALLIGVGIVAVACAVEDARCSRVPNRLVLAGGGIVLVRVVGGWLGTDEGLADVIAAAVLGLLTSGAALLFVMWLVRPEWIGGGDWKLLAVIGASLGIVDARSAFVALAVAVTVQTVLLVVLRRGVLPFAPALTIGHCAGALSGLWLHSGVGALR